MINRPLYAFCSSQYVESFFVLVLVVYGAGRAAYGLYAARPYKVNTLYYTDLVDTH